MHHTVNMLNIYDTLADIVKDTIENNLTKLQIETFNALKMKDKEMDKLNYKFKEVKKKESVLVKLIRDERVKVKLLEEKIEFLSRDTAEIYDAEIIKEVEDMICIQTELEKGENEETKIDETTNIEMQLNDDLNEENATYKDSVYGKYKEGCNSDGKELLENVTTSSDTEEDNIEDETDYEQLENVTTLDYQLSTSNEMFIDGNDAESSNNPSKQSVPADVDIEEMILNANFLIQDGVDKDSCDESDENPKESKEDEYINKLLEDDDEIEETIESLEQSFDKLAEIEEGCEFEQPVEEEILSEAIEKHFGSKRKRKQTERYAAAIMDLKESSDTIIPSSKRIKTNVKKMDESFDSSLSNKRRKLKYCGSCEGCLSPECEVCKHCKDKPKFGGKNRLKKKCVERTCRNIT